MLENSRKTPLSPKRFLCVGTYAFKEASTSWHRIAAIEKLGHDVTFVDSNPPMALKFDHSLPVRAIRRLFGVEFNWGRSNSKLIKLMHEEHFDALWIDKGTNISAAVFKTFRRRFPKGLIIGYSPDDMTVRANKSRRFVASLPYYDIYFTTKSYHKTELAELGCKKVYFIDNAYDDATHYPIPYTPEERERLGHSVIFIGVYEEERAEFMRYLADNGVSVRVWGGISWKKMPNPPPLLELEYKPVFGEEYAKAVASSSICLCFLRKMNRDLQTTRSMEIPACATMMVAERTDEHMALFEDGKEAVFFNTKEEMLEQIKYYLAHPDEIEAIAQAGRQRCLDGGYSNKDRVQEMLNVVFGDGAPQT